MPDRHRHPGRHLHRGRHGGDPGPVWPGRAVPGGAGQPGAIGPHGRPARRAPGAGPRGRHRHDHLPVTRRALGPGPDQPSRQHLALRGAQGVDRGRRDQPHGVRAGTPGGRDVVRGLPHPRDAQAHNHGRQSAGRGREPRGRRDREVRRTAPEREGRQVNEVFDDVDRAIKEIAAGRPVVVVDGADRENEGDIILAASLATPELLAFMIRYTSGVICVPLPGAELDRLHLPLMTSQNTEHMRTAFTLSVDARTGVSTGISAADRATTIARLVDPATTAQDLVRPGHIFPLRYAEGGVLRRPGHTEAAVDLARLAGLPPAGVLAEVVNDDGTMARLPELREFANAHDLALISIEQLVEYRRRTERQLTREAQTRLPNAFGLWQAYGYRHGIDGTEHVALVLGDVADGTDVLTRLHSECLTGDVFGSLRCDCGAQLEAAMAAIAAEGRGVVLYLRGHEGRGVGLLSKLRAYELQDAGADTVDANLELGLPADAREYSTGAQILADLGVRSVRLLTNNPDKVSGLSGFGIEVAGRVALAVSPTPENLRYLTVKRDRLGHLIDGLPAVINGSAADSGTANGTGTALAGAR